jgi:hypothetical protein
MLPTNVAIAPYNAGPQSEAAASTAALPAPVWLDPVDLLHVASALQTQVVRDLAPIWDVSAIVSPFLSLTDVPPGFGLIVLVPKSDTLPTTLGFHIALGGQPFALVEYGDDWSLLASHELMEMLCDPWGNRTAPGASLLRDDKQAGDQGQVEYLVEVCDPCQHSTYEINGVLVSDFVTPGYYDPVRSRSANYSFTGRVDGPRKLLDGGYITWRTHQPEPAVWQAFAPAGREKYPSTVPNDSLKIGKLFPSTFSREWIDAHRSVSPDNTPRPEVASKLTKDAEPLTAAQLAYTQAEAAAKQNGEVLSKQVGAVLAALDSLDLNKDATSDLLKKLTDPDGRQNFVDDVPAALAACGIPQSSIRVGQPKTVDDLASADDYQQALTSFDGDDRFGLDFTKLDLDALTGWLSWLGGF